MYRATDRPSKDLVLSTHVPHAFRMVHLHPPRAHSFFPNGRGSVRGPFLIGKSRENVSVVNQSQARREGWEEGRRHMGGADGQEGKGERRKSPKGTLEMMKLVGRFAD